MHRKPANFILAAGIHFCLDLVVVEVGKMLGMAFVSSAIHTPAHNFRNPV